MNYPKNMFTRTRMFKTGFYLAILTAALAVITFTIAILTPPLSGPFCKSGCFHYPFTDIGSRFPRDYIWMYFAIFLILFFLALLVFIHQVTPKRIKLFSMLGLTFGLIAGSTLLVDLFLQLAVIQPGIANGETDGISMLTQYNPHGVFIALEEIGYLLMSLSLFCLIPVFMRSGGIYTAIRWVFLANFALTLVSLVLISVFFGVAREYRFEVAAITLNYLCLIITGILLGIVFQRTLRKKAVTKKREAPAG